MSPVALSLNLLLAFLLLLALVVGWRLERRLKALRDSHAGFVTAVADLDRAARRAETGLATLRSATDEAMDLLVGRIDKAREVAAKLDQLSARAPMSAERLNTSAPAPGRGRFIEADEDLDPESAAEHLVLRLSRHDAPSLKPSRRLEEPGSGRPEARLAVPTEPLSTRRSRVAVDDDLFDAPATVGRILPGGRS